MKSLAFRSSTLAAVVLVVLAAPVRADDYAQIEKAKTLISEADQWDALACFDKTEQALVAAEKQLAPVDEIGKADQVARIKEIRTKMTERQRFWDRDAEMWRKNIERQISSDEESAMRSRGNEECFERSNAQLSDSWIKAHLDAKVLDELQKKQAWSKKKTLQAGMADEARQATGQIGRLMGGPQGIVEQAKTSSDDESVQYLKKSFAEQVSNIETVIAEHEKALGPEQAAEYRKQLATWKTDFEKNLGDAQFADLQKIESGIQEVLDGKNNNVHRENVENWFKNAEGRAKKCPQTDARLKPLTDKLAAQRNTWDGMVASGDRDAMINPIIEYWKTCKENYMKDAEGWEQETKPSSLQEYTHNSPSKLGCEKTEKLLSDVVQRFFDYDSVEPALKKYPNDVELKKAVDEANQLREKGSAKVIQFYTSLLDEAEKLPEGSERKDFAGQFYNLKGTLNHHCKGASGTPKLIARIDGLEKKWLGDVAAAESAKKAQDEKVCKSVEEAWPGLAKGWLGKVKRLNGAEAQSNVGAWKGTVVHFSGGARGVNMNRAGWDYFGDYAFVTDVDGVPVCGDLDSGVFDAIREVEKQTGIDEDNCEEAIGVVEGTCKITQRVKVFDQYVKGETFTGIKIRIVGWRACTVCAVAGEGTNLSKLKEYKEVSVKEQGVVTGGSSGGQGSHHVGGGGGGGDEGGGWIHRLLSWGLCGLLALVGALALGHGAAKFVPALQENLAKLGSGLGYAGIAFTAIGVFWFMGAIVFHFIWGHGFSVPSIAMIFAGVFVGLDVLKQKGTLNAETAAMIQPVGILLGLGCFFAAFLHFCWWDWMLL